MPRRRRSQTAADEETKSKAKRIKTEPPGVPSTQWEWEDDSNAWTAYTDQLSTQITDAMTNGQKHVELQLSSGVKLKVMFERMVQKNKTTGWDRRVRCCIKDEADTDFFSWEWEDEKGAWNPYSGSVAMDLEQARGAGDVTISVSACNRDYTVDVGKMEQINDATKVKRNIRRIKSAAKLPASAVKVELTEAGEASTSSAATTSGAAAKNGSTAKSGKKTSGRAASGRSGRKVKEEPEEEKVKTVVLKGAAPVDAECLEKQGSAHVYSEGKNIYDVMLNQTNVQNNNNKFFIIQLLEDDARKAYSVWFRWGRVGLRGQSNLVACGPDLEDAKNTFCKKFSDKTKNDWSERAKFKKVPGKYDLLQIDYSVKEEHKAVVKQKSVEVPDSTLDARLQKLIRLICDVKTMEEAVIEMKYDAKKMPLGKLTSKQIKAGYTALKAIDKCITAGDLGQRLVQACNDFYTRIPHCFGMRTPPLIRTKEDVKAKIQMLEALADIEIAMKIIKEGGAGDVNPVDGQYESLKCGLEPLDRAHSDFNLVERYLTNTHAPTHNQYTMAVLNVFRADKDQEDARFRDVGNRVLLWHGSRLTNWVGILSQGLRIAPPEAPVTGYMFGKGVYFADVSSKSANYCFATKTKNTGLLLLCEVALGQTNDLLAADYNAAQLPAGKDSVKGAGALAPDPKHSHTTEDGMMVPLGKCTTTGVKNPKGYTLNYNEFIVYDTAQVRMKYLVQVQFNFK